MLKQYQIQNFETLTRAFANGDVCLVDCADRKSGRPVAVICGMQLGGGELIELVPLARLIDGNPYEEVIPPYLEQEPCITH